MVNNLAQIEELFHQALSYDPEERRAYLENACHGDTVMRREVESLVAAYNSNSGLLDQTAVTLAMKVIRSRDDDSMIGEQVGFYRILNCLGRGGMGTVYLAEDLRLNRKVALKFLSTEFISDSWAKRQLIREAQAVAMLDHPNICAVYGFEEIGDYSFIVMQYIGGATLADIIRKNGLNSSQIIPLAQQIVSALGNAHAHGIIHRDIKPKNIMVTSAGQVKVLDFGLAKTIPKNLEDATESISQLSRDGLLVGTVAYMSPEQLRGEKVDYRSDIFSTGTVLYEMVCGRNPFAQDVDSRKTKSNAEIISSIMSEEPVSLRQSSVTCSREFDRIVTKCLRKNRNERYQSAAELLIDVENMQKGITSPTPVTSYLSVRFAAAAALLLLAAFVGVGIYRAWSRGHTVGVLAITCDEKTVGSQCVGPQISEGLAKTLSQRTGLRVASSQVTPSLYGPNAVSPRKAGSQLDADLVMYGNITRGNLGQILTIRVQRVADEAEVWQRSYALNPDKLLILEKRISLETAFQLQLPTNEDDKQLFELLAADDNHPTDAYTHYLLGKKYWTLRDGENIKTAIDHFRQATELDPSYAEAYAGIADCYVLLKSVAFGSLAGPDAMVRAKWAAKQALQFGNNLAESHNAYGLVLMKADWDWENAEKEFQKAIAINPDYEPAHSNYSSLLAVTGRFDEALRESEQAMNLEPFSGATIMNYCRTQYQSGRFNEADKCLDRLAVDQPNLSSGKYMHGIVYIALGRLQDATKIYEEIYAKDKAYGGAMLGYVYGLAGRQANAQQVLNEMQDYQKQHYLPDQELGIIYLGMNDLEHAFPLFRKAVEEKYPPAQSYFFSPSWDRLRADPRFPELAKEAGLSYRPPGSSPASTSGK
jgi:eukaryotic-like serine/threonine-protein kinase